MEEVYLKMLRGRVRVNKREKKKKREKKREIAGAWRLAEQPSTGRIGIQPLRLVIKSLVCLLGKSVYVYLVENCERGVITVKEIRERMIIYVLNKLLCMVTEREEYSSVGFLHVKKDE